MTIDQYVNDIKKRHKLGNATEHTFRGSLQLLIESLLPDIRATNEPKRQLCGAPDYILTKKDIPVGFIEAKNVGAKDLEGKKKTGNKEQFDRYRSSLENLIITDYLDFHLYIDGKFVTSVKLGSFDNGTITALPENYDTFLNFLTDFCTHIGQTIKSSKKLAEMMAGKAKMLSAVIEKALIEDEADELNTKTELQGQFHAFKDMLIHDINPQSFADIYAQTIAYGMFAARLHDTTLDNFTRQEAAELIPKSNPFLRKLFQYIAGYDLDMRIVWIVDGLADLFRATDIAQMLKSFGKTTQTHDPIIHFYETFLSEYDPKLRKARGVWYTPEPVVKFIVRAVDDILKTEFGLKEGIADTSKTKVKVKVPTHDKRYKSGQRDYEQEVHKVQILDPATGTGTFLAEVVKHIHKKFKGQQGIWSNYVEKHLIPRLNGFELLMASYAMAHLKLDMLLTETGYKATKDQRFKVYLTNSLEEHQQDTPTLFSQLLANEANEANQIKRDTPVMCIIGNPPYNGESSNKGDWIMKLMEDYKKEPGGKEKLKEQNSKFINDDYVKFLRYGQHFIEKNGSGILAFINPHGFLDNPTYRGMRWHLLKTYDKIYTIDLHGNNKKKETAPDGSADVNVFDIEQGVSINVFIKTKTHNKTQLGEVFHFDLYGKRKTKYDFLSENSLKTINFKKFTPFKNSFLFKNIDEKLFKNYNNGIDPTELFQINVMGFQTHRDDFCVDISKDQLIKRLSDFASCPESEENISKLFGVKSTTDFNIKKAQVYLQKTDINNEIIECGYRPLETRHIFYDRIIVDRPRKELINHSKGKNNILLGIGRQGLAIGNIEWCLVTVSKHPVDANIFRRGGVNLFPLYLYPEKNGQKKIDESTKRTPNLNKKIVEKITQKLQLVFTNEKEESKETFAPIDILDYIYAVLHSPSYRKKYNEFLKTAFPIIPYPKDQKTFWKLVKLGGEIRQIHLLESEKVEDYITSYPIDGSNTITTKVSKKDWEITDAKKKLGRIWINDEQYFDNIPLTAWEFFIGGYQPAQKWLKDRRDRTLEFDDILHYQKIIVALTETDRLMKEIDKIEIK